MSNLRPIRSDNLRPAPPSLSPAVADRLMTLADALCARREPFPLDASIARPGEVHAPNVAAVEAGRARLLEGSVTAIPERVVKVGRLEGQPPTLEWIGVDRLEVDEQYQRSTDSNSSRKLVASMVACWDWRLCPPLQVSRRPDSRLMVVDGQHRLDGARRRGDIPHLPCVVSSMEGQGEETTVFIKLNTQRRSLNQGELFNAQVASGDRAAIRAAELVKQAGLSFARHNNSAYWGPGQLFSGPAIASAIRKYGEEVVSNALVALAEAYGDTILSKAGTILPALYLIYSEDAKRPGFDPDLFIEALGAVEQNDWQEYVLEAKRQDPSLSRAQAYATAFIEQFDALRSAD